jgi:hypothetical protein
VRASLLIAALVAAAIAAAPARADVLVSRPEPAIRCGQAIRMGVWYRDFPATGHRTATIEVLSARGRRLWRRSVTATPEWRYWRYTPRCGHHYRVRYTTSTGATTFRVWVRRPSS